MTRIFEKVNFAVAAIAFTALILTSLLVAGNGLVLTEVSAENASRNQVSKESAVENLGNLPVYFEENRGQFHEKVCYFARGTSGYDLFLTGTDAVYVLQENPKSEDLKNPKSQIPNPKAVAVYISLAGANENPASVGLQTLDHRTNYFKGAEANWRTAIPNHRSVRMSEVYQGIDMVWTGSGQGGVQSVFVVQPNADANQIEWEVKGAEAVEFDAEGNLLIKTEYGEIRRQKPFAFQDADGLRQEIESRFVLSEASAGAGGKSFDITFELGNYDRTKPLTIEPSADFTNLSFSTFLGGSSVDEGQGIGRDNAGNVYVTGRTFSTDFPTTAGTIDTSQNGGIDVFVTGLNAAGTSLIYSTFLGGSGTDIGFGIAVDSAGNAIITGSTDSTTFPTTVGLDTTHNGLADVFVTKLNASGSALTYSTYLGGNQGDNGRGIVIDSTGNAYVCGNTRSTNYPTTGGAFDTTHNSSQDAFVTKINAAGSAVNYSTFLGGNLVDGCNGIAVDSAGNAFVTGSTQSAAFPTIAGAFDTSLTGSSDGFVTKINAAGSALIYSTFLGGNFTDAGLGIAVDSTGNAFVTGQTESTTFPTTVGAFNTTHNGGLGDSDVFVTKLDSTGTTLTYSTFLGGSLADIGNAIAINPVGEAYISGRTESTAFPTTAGAFDTTHNGDSDVFVTKFDAAGSALTHSTFVGDSLWDESSAIVIDSAGNAFITGRTQSPAYPTTAAYDTTHNGNFDVFATKLQLTPTSASVSVGGRVSTASGRGIYKARITLIDSNGNSRTALTNPFGYYEFDEVAAGQNYVVSVAHKTFQFANPSQVISVLESLSDIDFTALNQAANNRLPVSADYTRTDMNRINIKYNTSDSF